MKKTITEELNEIRKSGKSIAEKKVMLIKLGMRPKDIEMLEFSGFFNEDKPLTFGVEMECFNVRYANLLEHQSNDFRFVWEGYNHHDRVGVYKFTTDCSIQGDDPRECVSPILENTKDGFKSLENCCNILNACGARVNKSCGLHVHVGAKHLSQKAIVNVYKNYQKMEALIDSFMAPSRRGNESRWCKSIQGFNFDTCDTAEKVYHLLGRDRYHKVNPCAFYAHGTIEFRQHAGTIDYQKISMWVNFCCKLVTWSKENVFTHPVRDIEDVPFLNTDEKAFFKARINHFAMA